MAGSILSGIFAGNFFDDYTIKEQIEGAEWFSFAKLSDAEMNRAKDDARKIMAVIERNINAKQTKQQ